AAYFREALRYDPFHHEANQMLGLLLLMKGKREEADTHLRFMELFYPDDPNTHLQRAAFHALEGRKEDVATQLQKMRGQIDDPQSLWPAPIYHAPSAAKPQGRRRGIGESPPG